MPCPIRPANTSVCATAASVLCGSIHAHGHDGPYATTADSADASSHDDTAVSLDASEGHRLDITIVPSLAPPRRRRRRRRPRRPRRRRSDASSGSGSTHAIT